MTEVSFYHLRSQRLEQALPKLLERALDAGLRAVVLTGSKERAEALNSALWTYDPNSFLPHGSAADGYAEEQPVFLTVEEENPAGATVLVLTDGVEADYLGDFDRCLDMFDGNDEQAVQAARVRWRQCQAAGHAVTYWQQSPEGRWEKKA
ncbi:MAG: DNA polymerase III subunit chi [Sphingomonadales bacterium]